jgi:hypothetical protein
MASIFKPYKKQLEAYKSGLQAIVKDIEKFDTLSYRSIPEACKALTQLRESVNAQLAVVQNNMVVTEAALDASTASKATSGIQKAMQMIKTWGEEIIAAAQCFKLIAEIVVLLSQIQLLLSVKTAQLAELATKLALEKVTKFLFELKSDIINKINKAKENAVKSAKTAFYESALKHIQSSIKDTTKQITDRTSLLKSQGKSDDDLKKDSNLLELNQKLKKLQSFEQLVKDRMAA